jgi:hypothetical protein
MEAGDAEPIRFRNCRRTRRSLALAPRIHCDTVAKAPAAGAPCLHGDSELSRHPRHAPVADRDSDLPLPHTRNATTLLPYTAYDDNWAESELRRQKKGCAEPEGTASTP